MLDGSLNATPEERPLRLYRGSAASLPLVVVADDGSAVPLPDGLNEVKGS